MKAEFVVAIAPTANPDRLYRTARVLFFISGASSLIVETVLAKILGYILGITAHATAMVLAAFMAGLALGSWIIGKYSARIRQSIRLYGVLELIVGIYALVVPLLYPTFSRTVPLFLGGPEMSPVVLYIYRYAVATLVVILPAIVMGGTLPLLAQTLVRTKEGLQTRLGALYAINTLGATTGALVATYFSNYFIGLQGSLTLVFLMNLYIFAVTRSSRVPVTTEPDWSPKPREEAGSTALLALAFFTGVATFILENIWTHTLAAVVGMSVYAFGAMLGTLLFGIGSGAALLDRVRRRLGLSALALLGTALVVEGLLVVVTLPIWDRIPLVLPFIGYLNPGFAIGEIARFACSAILILGPALCMGASFPLLLELYSESADGVGRKVGLVYAWNTVGAILGSLATGFILIGRVSSQHILEATAAATILAGWVVCWKAGAAVFPGMFRHLRHKAPVAGLLLLAAMPAWNLDNLVLGGWITYLDPRKSLDRGKIIDHAEDPSGGIITVHSANGGRSLSFFTNGKFDSSYPTASYARNHSFHPALFARNTRNALTIGIGAGGNIGVLYRLGFQHIDGVDISAKMVEMARKYNKQGAEGAFDSSRLTIHIADGRNYLTETRKTYDVIVIELSAIWVADAGNLFNREFLELLRSHLSEGGVVTTYLQLKQINYEDLLIILNTMRQVFPHVAYFTTREQGDLIASMQPLEAQYENISRWNHDPEIQRLLSHVPDHDMFALLGNKLLFFPEEFQGVFAVLDRIPLARKFFLSTDMFPRAEYGAARGMLNRLAYEANYFKLLSASDPNRISPIVGVPSKADALAIAGAYHTERAMNSDSRDYSAAIRCYEAALALREEPEWRRRLQGLVAKHDPAAAAMKALVPAE
jgi:spermidine synthase